MGGWNGDSRKKTIKKLENWADGTEIKERKRLRSWKTGLVERRLKREDD